jgi:hypothetical protein
VRIDFDIRARTLQQRSPDRARGAAVEQVGDSRLSQPGNRRGCDWHGKPPRARTERRRSPGNYLKLPVTAADFP